jgi:hypothetical protein
MKAVIDKVFEVSTLPPDMVRDMPGVTRTGFVRISYEPVDENGFTEEFSRKLDLAIEEMKNPENLYGPFDSAEAMIADLNARIANEKE